MTNSSTENNQIAFEVSLTGVRRTENGIFLNSRQRCLLGDVCQIDPPKISTRNLSDDLEVSFVPMAAVSDVRVEITTPQRKPLREGKRDSSNRSIISAAVDEIFCPALRLKNFESFRLLPCALANFSQRGNRPLLDDLLNREQRTKDLAPKTIERVELFKKLARAFRGELNTK